MIQDITRIGTPTFLKERMEASHIDIKNGWMVCIGACSYTVYFTIGFVKLVEVDINKVRYHVQHLLICTQKYNTALPAIIN